MDREYANRTCPYCDAALHPLPKAKKRCPSCGRSIYVRSGPDGFRYLLQEVDLPTLEAAWDEHHEAQAAAETAEMIREATRLTSEALRSYRDAGIRSVQLIAYEGCDLCGPLDRQTFPIEDASPVPLPGCPQVAAGDICPCDWVPALE